VDEVQRVPVEMGYPEWNNTALSSPMRSNMADLNQQQQQQAYGSAAASPAAAAAAAVMPGGLGGGLDAAAAAAVTVAAAQERARLGGLGSREAVLPVQVGLVACRVWLRPAMYIIPEHQLSINRASTRRGVDRLCNLVAAGFGGILHCTAGRPGQQRSCAACAGGRECRVWLRSAVAPCTLLLSTNWALIEYQKRKSVGSIVRNWGPGGAGSCAHAHIWQVI
jgi:hypothetical protein